MNFPRPTFTPALVWLGIVTVLLCLPGAAFPTRKWYSDLQLDKWIHVGLFAITVFLFCFGFQATRKSRFDWRFFMVMGAGISYGILMEFMQRWFISHRSFDGWDIVANTVGGVTGFIAAIRFLPPPVNAR